MAFPSTLDTTITLTQAADGASSNLAAAITSTTATSVSLTAASTFVNGQILTIDAEQMQITAGGGTSTLTVTRAFNGTTAATHVSGVAVNGYIVAANHNQLAAAVIAIENSVPALSTANTFSGTNTFNNVVAVNAAIASTGSAFNSIGTYTGTGGSYLYGIYSGINLAASSTITGSINALFAKVSLGASASTSSAVGLQIYTPGLGTSAAITTNYGLLIDAQAQTGITTSYGIYQSGAGDKNLFYGQTTYAPTLTTAGASGLYCTSTISGTVSTAQNIYSGVSIPASTTTVTGFSNIETAIVVGASSSLSGYSTHLYMAPPSIGASSTCTQVNGLYIDVQKQTGVTTAYGIYQSGANDLNYFGGATGFASGLNQTWANSSSTSQAFALNHTYSGTQTTAYGITSKVTSASSVSFVQNYWSQILTATGGGVTTSAANFYASSPSIASGTTVATLYGMYLAAQATTGVTTAYGIYQAGSSDSNVFAGTTTINNVLNLYATLTSSVGTAVYSDPTISGTVSGATNFDSNPYVAASGTVTNLYHFLATSPGLGASATITNSYGMYVTTQKVSGVTNGYGIYQAGTSDSNYFAGATTFNLSVTVNSAFSANATSNSGNVLSSNAVLSGSGYLNGIVATGTMNGTGSLYNFTSAASVNNAIAGNTLYHYIANSPTTTGTGTIGTIYGLLISGQKQSFVTTAYGIYQAGTSDQNYLAGPTTVAGTLTASAAFVAPPNAVSSTTSLNPAWCNVAASASSAAITLTLPTSPVTGQEMTIYKSDTTNNVVTIAAQYGKYIATSFASVKLYTYQQSVTLLWDGTTWNIAAQAKGNWQAWTPTLAGGGSMTVSTSTINGAIFRADCQGMDFEANFNVTFGGTASGQLTFTLPVTPSTSDINYHPISAFLTPASGNNTIAVGFVGNSANTGYIQQSGAANFALSSSYAVYAAGSFRLL